MISEKLKLIMEKLGLKTQQAFADELEISRERLNNYIRKKSLPDTHFYQILKKKYPTIDIDSLIDDNIECVIFIGESPVFVSGTMPVNDVGKEENVFLKEEIKFLRDTIKFLTNTQKPTSQLTAR